jgi:cell division protein FtsB
LQYQSDKMPTNEANLRVIRKQRAEKMIGTKMKALFRMFVILFITAFAVGLGLDLHENKVCHIKKRLAQLEMENQELLEERYSLRREFAELHKERNMWVIEATRLRKKAGVTPNYR